MQTGKRKMTIELINQSSAVMFCFLQLGAILPKFSLPASINSRLSAPAKAKSSGCAGFGKLFDQFFKCLTREAKFD